ncbi:MAG: hypothetical protein R2715_08505 [Ilumatobacteraceae bacterium]
MAQFTQPKPEDVPRHPMDAQRLVNVAVIASSIVALILLLLALLPGRALGGSIPGPGCQPVRRSEHRAVAVVVLFGIGAGPVPTIAAAAAIVVLDGMTLRFTMAWVRPVLVLVAAVGQAINALGPDRERSARHVVDPAVDDRDRLDRRRDAITTSISNERSTRLRSQL